MEVCEPNLPPEILKEIQVCFEEDQISPVLKSSGKDHILQGFLGSGANPRRRYISSLTRIAEMVDHLKGLDAKIVYTAGVWDLIHIGHSRYLGQAKTHGDILIVGNELDSAVRIRKGPRRPVVPFNERIEMLCHLRHVDLVVPVPDYDTRGLSGMQMIEIIRPDVFVASKRSFPEAEDTAEWLERVGKLCGRVEIFESQAETSTSNKVRDLVIHVRDLMNEAVKDAKVQASQAIERAFGNVQEAADEAVRRA